MELVFVDNTGYCFLREEIIIPEYPELLFEDAVEMKEQYVKNKIKVIQNNFQHYLENKKYQVMIEGVQSKMNNEETYAQKLKIAAP